ncbi:hypothetical protein AAFN86_20875 [Roseomonas sp. CAU 1739]
MPSDTPSHRLDAVRKALANPSVKGELRTKLERLLKLGTEREILQEAMARQRGEAGPKREL